MNHIRVKAVCYTASNDTSVWILHQQILNNMENCLIGLLGTVEYALKYLWEPIMYRVQSSRQVAFTMEIIGLTYGSRVRDLICSGINFPGSKIGLCSSHVLVPLFFVFPIKTCTANEFFRLCTTWIFYACSLAGN